MDILTTQQRSENMASIGSVNTKPEITVRKIIHSAGFRYRLHVKKLPGNPDIVISKYRFVFYVNGCFWHQHKNCKEANFPKSNVPFWTAKLKGNVKRDKNNYIKLKRLGYNKMVIWECQITSKKNMQKTSKSLLKRLMNIKKI